ncbi:hypothetical protein D0962_24395 [Leptolyngbyaceae cyanobacterium CCMR0082]|uniref:Pentapeptide repeat-containing protein n=1 Tax=Adonisia turfae CCMR0082 TaxID=2304604 RepID=A0A6M0SD16_9CYAN|nr:pentapeptide repeat-containing protein [Adonisia turfae]NEZ65861.1 hypothetical protein [Adonisia turfae CCMR0082]
MPPKKNSENLRRIDFNQLIPSLSQSEKLNLFDRFPNADLRGSNFSNITLENVNFSGALIQGTNFKNSKLKNVNFSGSQAGLTQLRKAILCFFGLFLSVLAGFICAYAVDFLYTLISIPVSFDDVDNCQDLFLNTKELLDACIAQVTENNERYPVWIDSINRAIGVIVGILFIVALSIALGRGIGIVFASFIVLYIAIFFSLAALFPDLLTATSTLGLASFLGGISGVFTQSLASFFNEELYSQSNLKNTKSIKIAKNIHVFRNFLMLMGVLLGSAFGALLGATDFIFSMSISLCLIAIGHSLTILMRNPNYQSRNRYKVLYQAFKSSVRNLETNFSGAKFDSVDFADALIKNANFSNAIETGKGMLNLDRTDRNLREDVSIMEDVSMSGRDVTLNINADQVVFKDSQFGVISQNSQKAS